MKQSTAVRLFLLGLPIGTIFLGGASLVYWHQGEKRKEKAVNIGKSKEISPQDLAFFTERLAKTIGPRPATDAQKTREVLSFLEGTLGPNNIGFGRVERQSFPHPGGEAENLLVEIPGKRSGIVIIGTHYDTATDRAENADALAIFLSLAQSLVGAKPQSTVRFVAFGRSHAGVPLAERGSTAYAQSCKALGEKIVAFVELTSTSPSVGAAAQTAFLGAPGAEAQAKTMQEDFSAASQLPATVTAAAPNPMHNAAAFTAAGFPAVMVSLPATTNGETLTKSAKGLKRTLENLINER